MSKSLIGLSVLLMILGSLTGQAQVYSTLQGGPWNQPSTWVGGVVPAPGDDVVLVGPVTVEGLTFCHDLTIEPGGSLMAQSNIQPYMFTASGTIWNRGTIEGDNSLFPLAFTIGGDLLNEGTWRSFEIIFDDTLSHVLRAEPGSLFSPSFIYADSAHIISDRDAYLDDVEVRVGKLELRVDHVTQQPTTFHFINGSILRVDEIIGQNNAIAGDAASYIFGGVQVPVPVFRDIHIKGETLLNSNVTVEGNITIDDTLRKIDSSTAMRTVTVTGDIINNGAVIPNNMGYRLFWDCQGNFRNMGLWQSGTVTLSGTGTHYLYTDLGQSFNPLSFRALNSTVISDTSLRFDDTQIQIKKLVLQPGHDLYLQLNTTFQVDTLIGNYNRLHCNDASELWWTATGSGTPVYENIILTGTARLNSSFVFEGSLIVEGVMQIRDGSTTNRTVDVKGDITNTGSIALNNLGYGILFTIDGNLENRGPWQSGSITLGGSGTNHLFTDPGQTFSPYAFYAWNSTVISDTLLHFDDVNVQIGKLILQPGHNLHLYQNSTFRVDTLVGNDNRLHSHDTSKLWYTATGTGTPVYQNITLADTTRIDSDIIFEGTLTVEGILKLSDGNNYHRLTIKGNIRNTGSIAPNNTNSLLAFTVEGNLENQGQWQSNPVELEGTTPQQVAIPDSAGFQAELRIHAMRSGNQYQWLRNGTPLTNGGNISGATTSMLTLSSITPADYGTYQCEIDSGGTTIYSREVIITDAVTGVTPDDPTAGTTSPLPRAFFLGQNYPNPFNPVTTVEFGLPKTEWVTLKIYDLLGREIKTLVNDRLEPGYHTVQWDGVDETGKSVASGIYLYRLQVGSFVQTRKMTLLR